MEMLNSTPDIRKLRSTSHFNLLLVTPHKLDQRLWSISSLHHPLILNLQQGRIVVDIQLN